MEMGKSGKVAFILLFLGFFVGLAGYTQAGAIQKSCSFRQPTVDPHYNITPGKP
jgi:hypothetical protein